MATMETGKAETFDFRSMVEHVPAMVWTAKPNGALDFVSPATLLYFARTFAQMIERGWAEVVHPDDLPQVGEHWSHSLETGEPYRLVFRLRRASDGTYRKHLVSALAQRNADGPILRWCGIAMDIEGVTP